nr:class GN sortase [Marinifaba aquimaris]
MPAKAIAAQFLLEWSWRQNMMSEQKDQAPWFWADTTPIAKLSYQKQQVSWIVLAGLNDRNLAFGPSWQQDSAKPNRFGNTIIAAHNDSHFAVLEEAKIGDTLTLQNNSGLSLDYQIAEIEIVDENYNGWNQVTDDTRLTLFTCYPFELAAQDNQQRLMITAVLI